MNTPHVFFLLLKARAYQRRLLRDSTLRVGAQEKQEFQSTQKKVQLKRKFQFILLQNNDKQQGLNSALLETGNAENSAFKLFWY